MKKIVALLLSALMLMSLCIPASAGLFSKDEAVLRLIVPENWEMTIGDSRTVDLAADNTSNYVQWSADPADIADVDAYGRVTALKEGKAVVTAQNAAGITKTMAPRALRSKVFSCTVPGKRSAMACSKALSVLSKS